MSPTIGWKPAKNRFGKWNVLTTNCTQGVIDTLGLKASKLTEVACVAKLHETIAKEDKCFELEKYLQEHTTLLMKVL